MRSGPREDRHDAGCHTGTAIPLQRLDPRRPAHLAQLCTAVIGVVVALGRGHIGWALSSGFLPLLAMIHWYGWISVALWAVLTGGLCALGLSSTPATVLTRNLAVLGGVLIPVGLVLWAKFLHRDWPGTTAPLAPAHHRGRGLRCSGALAAGTRAAPARPV